MNFLLKQKYGKIFSNFNFIVYCEKNEKQDKYYPKHYCDEIFEIINLKSGTIEYGKEYDFKIKSKGYKFFILQSDFEKKYFLF